MVDQVFISYASNDKEIARRVRAALGMRNIGVWWAPESIGTGERFSDRIATELPSCKVFLLLWSNSAAESPHVRREISIAADHGLEIYPVRLDNHKREEYYTQGLAWGGFKELGADGIAREVDKCLRLLNLAYPLHDLYRNTVKAPPDLPLDIEALRIVVRFVTLLHAAKYAGQAQHSDEVNARIESALASRCLFADLDAARQTAEWLDDHQQALNPEWNQFFKWFGRDVPTLADFESDDNEYAAAEFDRRNLPRLLGLTGERHQDGHLSNAIRNLLKDLLSVEWLASSRLTRQDNGGGERRPLTDRIHPAIDNREQTLFWECGTETLSVSPFLGLMTVASESVTALLRQNSGSAVYSTFLPNGDAEESRDRLALPWGSLAITREIPDVIYAGESHQIQLRLTNNSPGPVRITRLIERLPDNLAAADGSGSVEVATDLELGADETRRLEYVAVGAGVPGSRRSFTSEKVAYLFRDEENFTAIKGKLEVVVRVLPAPQLVVARVLENLQHDGDRLWAPLDALISVRVEVHSAGGPIADVRLEENFEGCELVEGNALIHSGGIARRDLQSPITATYQIRVTSTAGVFIRLQSTGSAVAIEGADLQFRVRDMPPPRLESRWTKVSRNSPMELNAELRIDNTGGTSANHLVIAADAPGDIQMTPSSFDLGRLEANDTVTILLRVAWVGIPSANLDIRISFRDVHNVESTHAFRLDLNRVVEADMALLPVAGRKEAREGIAQALTDQGVVLINIHGVRGSGKRCLLRSEVDRLQRGFGRQAAIFEVDCRPDKSFAESVFRLFEEIVYQQAPAETRGSDSVFTTFLRNAGMDEREYQGPVSNLRALLAHQKPDSGSWYALGLLLPKLAKSRGYQTLVLLFHEVSRFYQAELEGLSILHKHLQKSTGVRIAVTSLAPLKMEEIDRSILVGALTDEDCRELISRVFILPKASRELEQALIEKSEHLPVNLVSLLQRVVEDSDRLIDFESPAGARITDVAAFRRIPTSLLESELRSALAAGVPEIILACLAAAREPLGEAQLARLLDILEAGIGADDLRQALKTCEIRQWLRASGKKYEVASATIREALRRAASPEQYEAANQALFTWCEEEKRKDAECFQYLVECPGELLRKRQPQLAAGLRVLVASSSFSQVRLVLDRLQKLKLAAGGLSPDLAVIQHELQWAESGDLDGREAEALLEKLRKSQHEHTVAVRLSLLLSRWYANREGNYQKAAAVAEACAHSWGPFKHFEIDDAELEFEFYLNLWAVYYRLLDEERFKRIDAQVWKRVLPKQNGQQDSYAIARFLGLFLEFQREFASLAERQEHFPRPWTYTMGERRPLRDNAIEVLTRTERLSGTELEGFLLHPDKLNQNNALVLGKLYLDLGRSLWAQSSTRSQLEGRTSDTAQKDNENAEGYVTRAESLFAEGRFRLDMAHARAALGGIYTDRLQLAEKSRNGARVKELSTIASRWLQMAVADFEGVEAEKEAFDTLTEYANVERIWAQYQPDRLDDAICAYERLVGQHTESDESATRDDQRLALVQLYQQAGKLAEASGILGRMKAQTAEIAHLQAIVRSAMLQAGEVAIDRRNYKDFERDLETLGRSPALTHTVGVMAANPIRTSADACGLIAWKLALFFTEQQEVLEAMRVLRAARDEIFGWPPLRSELGAKLPDLMFRLWQMEGPEDDQLTQDFSNLIVPLLAAETRPAIDHLLESVWEWEATRRGPVHVAAAEMSLVLCERFLEPNSGRADGDEREMDAERKVAAEVFGRLVRRNAWHTRRVPRMVARSVTFILRCGATRRDQSVIQNDLTPLIETLKTEGLFSAALQVMVNLVEMLLDAHMSTQDAWYYGVITQLAGQLRPLQELSENNFDEITHLISVYLQLPTGITDAVDLMEKQCKHLLAERDYGLLPAYLSFLADLLSGALRKDVYLLRILRIVEQSDPSAIERVTANESKRSTAVRQVATQLCGEIIAELRTHTMGRKSSRSVLYNATKLLPDNETSDLQVAIYTKLYESSDHVEGSCVWGVYSAWAGSPTRSAAISEADMVALTTFSNADNEGLDGTIHVRDGVIQGSARNYLITSRARNALLLSMSQSNPRERDFQLIYACLELHRLLFLRNLVSNIHRFLKDFDEFERMEWVTFLHTYLFSAGEGAPFWQKLKNIESGRKDLELQIEQCCEGLGRMGMLVRVAVSEQLQQQIAPRVQPFLFANVKRGREVMAELVDRMRMFSLEDVLGEVQRHMAEQERALDFGSILRLWMEEHADDRLPQDTESGVAFFEADPVKLIAPATSSGLQLILQGEGALAEKVYQFALKLCDVHGMAGTREYGAALRGLLQALGMQKKYAEARELVDRLLEMLEARSDPQAGTLLYDLAEMLKANNQNEGALVYAERRVEWERRQPAATNRLLDALRDNISLLWIVKRWGDSEPLLRELTEAEDAAHDTAAVDSVDFYHYALVLVFEDKNEEAFVAIQRAWHYETDPDSLGAARTLFVRACVALVTGRDAGQYIGHVKAVIESDAFREIEAGDDARVNWDGSTVLARVKSQLPPETGELMLMVGHAIEDPEALEKLEQNPLWTSQPAIAPERPGVDLSTGAGA